jgi:Zn-dependent peptidase ImmA (M78 family)
MSDRYNYFESMKVLAREKRALYSVNTDTFGLRELRVIYKAEQVKIDLWDCLPAKVKAVYMCDADIYSVAVQPKIPAEPKLFALVHELKHHYCDRDKLSSGELSCGDYNSNELIEVGAEVFAAEFVYPEDEFQRDAIAFLSSAWNAEDIVRFKRNCSARVSYMFIRKRLERLQLIGSNEFQSTQFKKLEEQMFGVPIYKQEWFKKRQRRA